MGKANYWEPRGRLQIQRPATTTARQNLLNHSWYSWAVHVQTQEQICPGMTLDLSRLTKIFYTIDGKYCWILLFNGWFTR